MISPLLQSDPKPLRRAPRPIVDPGPLDDAALLVALMISLRGGRQALDTYFAEPFDTQALIAAVRRVLGEGASSVSKA